MQTQNAFSVYDYLPAELQLAQSAIEKPEIQEILKTLSKYNLGITMPHKHNEATGDFELLQENEMQIEEDLSVSFMLKEEASKINAVPVSWMWSENAVTPSQQCVVSCVIAIDESGNKAHRAKHTDGTDKN